MPWSVGSNVTAGSVLTASRYNQDVIENLNAIGGVWTAYTPTWTNVTLGTSPTHQSAYLAAGKLHIVRIRLTLGTGGSLSGAPEATLPNGVSINSAYSDFARLGWGSAVDASPTAANLIHVSPSSTTNARVRFYLTNAASTYLAAENMAAATPWTWTTGDQILAQFMFEAA